MPQAARVGWTSVTRSFATPDRPRMASTFLAELGPEDDDADRTLLLAVLRGCLLDLLATGDVDRTSAAVQRYLCLIGTTSGR